MLTFRINDLNRWGIENRSPQTLLQTDFDGIVKDVMQSESINALISDRVRIKEQIFLTLKDQPINVGGLTWDRSTVSRSSPLSSGIHAMATSWPRQVKRKNAAS